MEKSSFSVFIYLKKIFRIINYLFLFLFFMNILSCFLKFVAGHPNVYGLVPRFEFRTENNVPTYFSSFNLLVSAILLKVIALFKKIEKDRFFHNWSILSVIFLFLSIDETASMHELLTYPLKKNFTLTGIFNYSWVIIGFLFVLILFIFYSRFLFSLPSKTKYQFLLAGFIFVGGAIGIEMIGGNYKYFNPEENLVYAIITTVEESFEMIGVIIFIGALINYIENNISDVTVIFKSKNR